VTEVHRPAHLPLCVLLGLVTLLPAVDKQLCTGKQSSPGAIATHLDKFHMCLLAAVGTGVSSQWPLEGRRM
jgi:hypothetical protein